MFDLTCLSFADVLLTSAFLREMKNFIAMMITTSNNAATPMPMPCVAVKLLEAAEIEIQVSNQGERNLLHAEIRRQRTRKRVRQKYSFKTMRKRAVT